MSSNLFSFGGPIWNPKKNTDDELEQNNNDHSSLSQSNINESYSDKFLSESSKKYKHATRKKSANNEYKYIEKPVSRYEIAELDRSLDTKLSLDNIILPSSYHYISFDYPDSYSMERFNENKDVWKDCVSQACKINKSCDETIVPLIDYLTVSAVDMGNLLRKVRKLHLQSYIITKNGFDNLYQAFCERDKQFQNIVNNVELLQEKIINNENRIREESNVRIAGLEAALEDEKKRSRLKRSEDEDRIDSLKLHIHQLSEEISVANMKSNNLETKYAYLETNKSKSEVINAQLQAQVKEAQNCIAILQNQVKERDNALAGLMEREALRDAEIRKLTHLTNLKPEENSIVCDDMSIEQPATSVLCIRCKGRLDDFSTIEDAILAKGSVVSRTHCEFFRILLDPAKLTSQIHNRSVSWTRITMRSILQARVKQQTMYDNEGRYQDTINYSTHSDIISTKLTTISAQKPKLNRFYQFTYQWFEKNSEPKKSDEDRLSFYVRVRALVSQGDSEGALFWTLLSDCFGLDGAYFTISCLSCIQDFLPDNHILKYLDHVNTDQLFVSSEVAMQATRILLHRSNQSEMDEVFHTISALTVDSKSEKQISLFLWLRIMLRQLQGDQLQRNATLQLMVDTALSASYGPTDQRDPDIIFPYSQFKLICQALFSNFEITDATNRASFKIKKDKGLLITEDEIMELYNECYYDPSSIGRRGISAETISKFAEKRELFLRLHISIQNELLDYKKDVINSNQITH